MFAGPGSAALGVGAYGPGKGPVGGGDGVTLAQPAAMSATSAAAGAAFRMLSGEKKSKRRG